MQFLPSSNGLTTIHAKDVNFYRGTIDLRLTDRFTVLSGLKEWMDRSPKEIGTVSTDSTTLYHREHGFSEALTIYGYYPIDCSNENEMYETIYSLFQFLSIKCKQKELLFSLHFYQGKECKECKECKIVCKK